MNQMLKISSEAIEMEAELRRAELFDTTRQLRHNLAPEQLFEEARNAASQKAGSTWRATQDLVAKNPLATICLAAGAAVLLGTSLKSRAAKTATAAAVGALADSGAASAPAPRVGVFAALRNQIAASLGSMADASYQAVQDRYKEKARNLQDDARTKVLDLTESVLEAGEKIVTTFLSEIFAAFKAPKKSGS